jgi:predicted metal-binding protein
MSTREKMRELFHEQGFSDFKWIDPREIIVSQWVRMKCRYGCKDYGKTATCPPNVPSIDECERFFQEYKEAAVFHFEKKVAEPEDRYAWGRKLNLRLLKLEKKVFLAGYERAFLLFFDSCSICEVCPGKKEECLEPRLSRPTPEALCVDVYSTVRKIGYPIQVLSDYSQMMNRYAFLLVE